MMEDLSLCEFAAALASDAPAPGGGSAAAHAGANAAALLAMVCRLTVGRDEPGTPDAQLAGAIDEADALRARLLRLVGEDAAAYETVVAAFRLSKTDDEQHDRRRGAIRAATIHAARVPLETMQSCRRLLDLAAGLAGRTNANAASDLGVALQLARAGLEGGALNVAINLATMEDDGDAPAVASECRSLLQAGRAAFGKAARTAGGPRPLGGADTG